MPPDVLNKTTNAGAPK